MILALYDIDGVLANDTHRVQHALAGEWAKYFDPANVASDEVFEEGREHVQERLEEGFTVGYLTGRSMQLQDATYGWLDANQFPFGRLITRGWWTPEVPDSERETLAQFKLRVYGEILVRPEVEDVVLYEDDPEVVRVINEAFGPASAVLIPWHVKLEALVKKATA